MATRFRTRLAATAVVLAVAAGLGGWWLTAPRPISGELEPRQPDLENGRILFLVGGCPACHATAGEKDDSRLGGGRALPSPFGTFYATNISPHPDDGIGAWSEADFVTAMLRGVSPDGRHYFPAFPYTSYQRMPVSDVRDLFGYLRTLPPVAGRPPDHDVPFPFDVRRGIGLWKRLYLDGEPFRPDPDRPPEWNRGAYLVEGPGHCAECHSPRSALGGIVADKRFTGGPNPAGDGSVPDITRAGIGEWSQADLVDFLSFGMEPDGDFVGGDMAIVVRHLGQIPPEDVSAIATYVRSLGEVERPAEARGRAPTS